MPVKKLSDLVKPSIHTHISLSCFLRCLWHPNFGQKPHKMKVTSRYDHMTMAVEWKVKHRLIIMKVKRLKATKFYIISGSYPFAVEAILLKKTQQ